MDYPRSAGNQAAHKKLDTSMERANKRADALRRLLAQAETQIAERYQADQKTAAALASIKKQPGAINDLLSMVKGR
ncbi:hypothetical protein ABZ154_12555 [Streptomyces sp. NPDC006261]|uniref:hypothetical protein n=1 Tax=Streptomyces sp. NPDC006261 TaxID=3156739 RepID=UPI0033B84445